MAAYLISIHPPLAGRDLAARMWTLMSWQFQSTRPSRGETFWTSISTRPTRYFNPPAPRGARRSSCNNDADPPHFNPPAPRGARLRLSSIV